MILKPKPASSQDTLVLVASLRFIFSAFSPSKSEKTCSKINVEFTLDQGLRDETFFGQQVGALGNTNSSAVNADIVK